MFLIPFSFYFWKCLVWAYFCISFSFSFKILSYGGHMSETILENQHRYYNKNITFYPSIPHQASITFFFFFKTKLPNEWGKAKCITVTLYINNCLLLTVGSQICNSDYKWINCKSQMNLTNITHLCQETPPFHSDRGSRTHSHTWGQRQTGSISRASVHSYAGQASATAVHRLHEGSLYVQPPGNNERQKTELIHLYACCQLQLRLKIMLNHILEAEKNACCQLLCSSLIFLKQKPKF